MIKALEVIGESASRLPPQPFGPGLNKRPGDKYPPTTTSLAAHLDKFGMPGLLERKRDCALLGYLAVKTTLKASFVGISKTDDSF